MDKRTAMQTAAEFARQCLALKAEGKNSDAGMVLCFGAEQIAQRFKLAYADAKQMIGFHLQIAA